VLLLQSIARAVSSCTTAAGPAESHAIPILLQHCQLHCNKAQLPRTAAREHAAPAIYFLHLYLLICTINIAVLLHTQLPLLLSHSILTVHLTS
jgi:hypothetical protein